MKKQLDQARNELYKTTDVTTSAEKLLREKDHQITELMEEGAFCVNRERLTQLRVSGKRPAVRVPISTFERTGPRPRLILLLGLRDPALRENRFWFCGRQTKSRVLFGSVRTPWCLLVR